MRRLSYDLVGAYWNLGSLVWHFLVRSIDGDLVVKASVGAVKTRITTRLLMMRMRMAISILVLVDQLYLLVDPYFRPSFTVGVGVDWRRSTDESPTHSRRKRHCQVAFNDIV